ncbi:thioesterase domain-containing protein [Amycolatopsis keratiniphila]|nr:thioesterase domain-containing protein [Amycolatopsis keratiniphila]
MSSETLDPETVRAARLSGRRRALYDLVRAERRALEDAAAVDVLRTGAGAPVVLVNPLSGQLFAYTHLVSHLTTERPVLALPADVVLGRGEGLTFQQLAARYVDRLRLAGTRPAVLAGWSIGGVLAYEIGYQLSAHGTPCPVLLIDSAVTPPEHLGAVRPAAMLVREFVENFAISAGLAVPAVADWSEPWPVLSGLAEAGGAGLSPDDLLGRYRTHVDAIAALDDYAPSPAVMPVHVVRASRTSAAIAARWAGLVAGELPLRTVDTDHHGLLHAPAVAEVAEDLDRLADSAQEDR